MKRREPQPVDPEVIKYNIIGDISRAMDEEEKIKYEFAIILNSLLENGDRHQEDLVSDLKISSGSVSKYCNGRTEPKLVNLVRMAKYLKVDCNYLMTGVKAENNNINEYTGLSEYAIETLHNHKEYADILSKLIEQSSASVLYHILKTEQLKQECKTLLNKLQSSTTIEEKAFTAVNLDLRYGAYKESVEKIKELFGNHYDVVFSFGEFPAAIEKEIDQVMKAAFQPSSKEGE